MAEAAGVVNRSGPDDDSATVAGPISGNLSGVAARKPVHVRNAESVASRGKYSIARASIRVTIDTSTRLSSTSNCRDDPISSCPVVRG